MTPLTKTDSQVKGCLISKAISSEIVTQNSVRNIDFWEENWRGKTKVIMAMNVSSYEN